MLEKFFKKNPIILKYFSRSLRAIVNILDNLLPTYKSALVVSYAGKRIDVRSTQKYGSQMLILNWGFH